MKKLLCLLMIALLSVSVSIACAEATDMRTVLNPNGYSLIDVCDYWYDDDGEEHIVQGSLGDYIVELDAYEGFQMDEAHPFTLSPDAEIMLPNADGAIVPTTIDELAAYIDALREMPDSISFYCEFELNAAGELTKLIYCVPDEYDEAVTPVHCPEDYNPNHYSLMKIDDAFQCDDEDYVVSATFGDCDYSDEAHPKAIGFEGDPMLITLTLDVEIEMSTNLDDGDIVPMSVVDFVELVRTTHEKVGYEYTFYCNFEMNDEGELTKLTYTYLPF